MLKRNIVANFLGKIFPNVISFFAVPVYLHYLGVQSYGLLGFFLTLQGLIAFLDMGLSTAANREVASKVASQENVGDLVRTLETIYFSIAVAIALIFALASDWIATHWILDQTIATTTLSLALEVAGLTIALRWPISLYNGVLLGLQRQVQLNVISASFTIVRTVSAIFVVVAVSSTVLAYLYCHLAAAVIELILMNRVAWSQSHIRCSDRPRFQLGIIKKVWRFSLALMVVSLLATVLKQFDRLAITRLLSLEAVGYYTTAYVLYSTLSNIVSPVVDAVFPRFSSLITNGNERELAGLFHRATQIVSFVIVPVAYFLAFFSREILELWTRSPIVAANAAAPLSALAVAYAFNAVMHVPMAIQYAKGITSIAVGVNVVGVITCLPLMYIAVSAMGIAGAGLVWLVFNVGYFLIAPFFMHRRIMAEEKMAWYLQDTLPFFILAALIMGLVWGGEYYFSDSVAFVAFFIGMVIYVAVCYCAYSSIRSIIDLTFNSIANLLRR